MKKRVLLSLLALLCAVVMLTFTVSAEETSGTCGENLTWTFSDGTLTISGTGPMYDFTQYARPWEDYESPRRIIIEEGVTSIGSYAFANYWNVEEVSLPDSLEVIGKFAFYDCDKFIKLEIPANVKLIDYQAFRGCGYLSLVTFAGDMPSIHGTAFEYANATIVYPGNNET